MNTDGQHEDTGTENHEQKNPVREAIVPVVALTISTIALGIGIAYGVTFFLYTPTHQRANMSAEKVTTQKNIHTIRKYNFAYTVPDLLYKVATHTPTLPAGIVAPKVTYAHKKGACMISYAELVTHHPYTTTHIEDVSNEGARITKVETRHATSTTILTAYYPLYYRTGDNATHNVWVLFTQKGDAPSEVCQRTFLSLLHTLTPVAPPNTRMSRTATGTLSIQIGTPTRLLFHDAQDGYTYTAHIMDVGPIAKPLLYGDALYFIGTDGALKFVELFGTSTAHTLPLVRHEGDSINDYFIDGTNIFFLIGAWCNGATTTSCNLRLYEYDTETKGIYSYVDDITSNRIIAYDDTRLLLYLEDTHASTTSHYVYDVREDTYLPGDEVANTHIKQVRAYPSIALHDGTLQATSTVPEGVVTHMLSMGHVE